MKLAEVLVSVSVDIFLQCPSQVAAVYRVETEHMCLYARRRLPQFIESSLSLARRLVRIGEKVVIAGLGD